MSARSLNWLKFGSLVALAFALGLFFAGLVDAPTSSSAQQTPARHADLTPVSAPVLQGTGTLIAMSEGFADVAAAVKPSVVLIQAQRNVNATSSGSRLDGFFDRDPSPRFQEGRGSGFIVSRDGLILTNNHVIDGAERVIVQLPDRREFTAEIIGADASTDLAVLKIEADDLIPAALGNSDETRVGEWVLAIGNPLGETLTFTVTSGIVSAKGRGRLNLPGYSQTSIQDFIQTDAAINPGNSGGPLVNLKGEVIGINSAIASETGYNVGYGFAIPINLVRNVMTQLIENGRVRRAALMVSISPVTPVDAEYAGLDEIRGVMIRNIPDPGSPALEAGIRPGDIVLSIEGKDVNYVAELQQEIGFRKPGEVVEVELARKGGERTTVKVTLAELDTAPQVAQVDAPEDEQRDRSGAVMDLLGATVEPLLQRDADRLGLDEADRGLVVVDVRPGGPSWERLGRADIITAVEGRPVRTQGDLRSALDEAGPGTILSFDVIGTGTGSPMRRIVRIRLGD